MKKFKESFPDLKYLAKSTYKRQGLNKDDRFHPSLLLRVVSKCKSAASVASSPPSSRPQAVAPRPLWRLPPPAFVASSPQSSRPRQWLPDSAFGLGLLGDPPAQDGYDAVGYGIFKCFLSSTFDFDSFDEIFLLFYYY